MNHLIPTTSIRGYQPSSSGRIPQYENCRLCPRSCGANRYEASGFCGCGTVPKAARAALHQWEEPCLSGIHGSGTVFFSGCTLRCCFCQNYRISSEGFGKEISVSRLSEIFLELQEQGAHNINLVTATQFLPIRHPGFRERQAVSPHPRGV